MPIQYYQTLVFIPITLILCIAVYLTFSSNQKLKFLVSSLLSIFSLHFILIPMLAIFLIGKDGSDKDEYLDQVLLLSALLQVVIIIPLLFWLSKAFKITKE